MTPEIPVIPIGWHPKHNDTKAVVAVVGCILMHHFPCAMNGRGAVERVLAAAALAKYIPIHLLHS